MTNVSSITVTIPNPTAAQLTAITKILEHTGNRVVGEPAPLEGLTTRAKRGASKPAKTVSKEEDEDFGEDEIEEDDLEIEEDDADEEADEDSEDEPSLDFRRVKEAIDKYGEKNPKGMKAIYAGFNIKNTAELKTLKKKWAPVYNKVMAKLKPARRARD